MNRNISLRAAQYLRALKLAALHPLDPAGIGLARSAPPSTDDERSLECSFVEALLWRHGAETASTTEAAAEMLRRGQAARDVVDAAGEREPAREALAIFEAESEAAKVMRFLQTANTAADILDRVRKGH